MPAPFPPAIGLILSPGSASWAELSRARIRMGAVASRCYVLIETFAVTGSFVSDDLTLTSLAQVAARCSVDTLLVADDVPMSYLNSINAAGTLVVKIVSPRPLALPVS